MDWYNPGSLSGHFSFEVRVDYRKKLGGDDSHTRPSDFVGEIRVDYRI
jgi:hypothetical protein